MVTDNATAVRYHCSIFFTELESIVNLCLCIEGKAS